MGGRWSQGRRAGEAAEAAARIDWSRDDRGSVTVTVDELSGLVIVCFAFLQRFFLYLFVSPSLLTASLLLSNPRHSDHYLVGGRHASAARSCLEAAPLHGLGGEATQMLDHACDEAICGVAPSSATDVLSAEDVVVGIVLAFLLAFGYSYLNGRSSSTSFVSWPSQSDAGGSAAQGDADEGDKVLFDTENWKEMSREENYVLYNTRIRQKLNAEKRQVRQDKEGKRGPKLDLPLLGLLVLFIPIFSVETFFALSRQLVCEMGTGRGELAQKLCSPLAAQ